MKASEARAKAMKILNANVEIKEELDRIYNAINTRVEAGGLSLYINIDYKYHEYITTKLKEDGYKVDIVFENFNIQW